MSFKDFKDLQEKYKAVRKKYEDANIKYLKELYQRHDLVEKDLEEYIEIDIELRKKHGVDKLQKELIEMEQQLIEKGKDALYKTKDFQQLPRLDQQEVRRVLEDKSLSRLCNIREKVLNILANWKIN